jgi:hypothetical protein
LEVIKVDEFCYFLFWGYSKHHNYTNFRQNHEFSSSKLTFP